MAYRCVATTVAGFIQQLAVSYVANGYHFYVAGRVPDHKEPAHCDQKIIAQYGIDVSKWTRSRRKKQGYANVHYLRYDRFYVIVASCGKHPFFAAEAKQLRDIRDYPIHFRGHTIGYRRARNGRSFHVSVRIDRELYRELKWHFEDIAVHRSVEDLCRELRAIDYEPYAPVRVQLGGILRTVNHRRKAANMELVPRHALWLRRFPVRPFD